tara:strand:+ start:360 stop:482 length:123 start_codon:yes stop_codon:yes gene_type:complete
MCGEPEWTPEQEQYYLENPDEWPGVDDVSEIQSTPKESTK